MLIWGVCSGQHWVPPVVCYQQTEDIFVKPAEPGLSHPQTQLVVLAADMFCTLEHLPRCHSAWPLGCTSLLSFEGCEFQFTKPLVTWAGFLFSVHLNYFVQRQFHIWQNIQRRLKPPACSFFFFSKAVPIMCQCSVAPGTSVCFQLFTHNLLSLSNSFL